MRCVDGYNYPGYVIKLRKALYGLKNSPREWYKTLRAHLLSLGLVACANMRNSVSSLWDTTLLSMISSKTIYKGKHTHAPTGYYYL